MIDSHAPDDRADQDQNETLDPGTVTRALHAANNLVVITDPHREDNPIVWVNDYFCDFTGYSRDEVIGRNCRFLQGDDRDQPERYELRATVDEGRRTHVLIRNYRKDGSLFYNDLYVSPVRDDTGAIRYFIGVQNDVTERVRAVRLVGEREREVQETAENERERFGMDLHDGLGQTLAGASMLSHALAADLNAFGADEGPLEDLPAELRERVRTLARHARALHKHVETTVSEARTMAHGLNPVDASATGLGDALRRLAESVQEANPDGPSVDVRAEDVTIGDRRVTRHLYRIAQEAVSNAVRHAQATRIRVTLQTVPQGTVLEVEDDGVGIERADALRQAPRPDADRGGRGLPSIRYRADLIGARIDVRGRTGGGTTVRVMMPTQAPDTAAHRRSAEG